MIDLQGIDSTYGNNLHVDTKVDSDNYPQYVLFDAYKMTVYHKPKWVYNKALHRDLVRAACGVPDLDNNLELYQNTLQNTLGRRPCKKCFHL